MEPGLLGAMRPLDLFAATVGAMMLVIAAALWLASRHTDRLALRLFALRYALAGAGWFLVHPESAPDAGSISLASAAFGTLMVALTLWALDEYLGRSSPRRRAGLAAATALALLALWVAHRLAPASPAPIYTVLGAGMAYAALVSAQAARRERNAGHAMIAVALASYPLLLAGVLLAGPRVPDIELGYLVAGPAALVGVTILVASLIRARQRVEAELAQRRRAEEALRRLNASLEDRVAERTAELRLLVDGLEAFTRSVSHDLRGSLAGVASLLRLAEQALAAGDQARAQRLLAPAAPQLEQMVELVHRLLELSRVGDATLQRQPVALEGLARDALAQLALTPDGARALQRTRVEFDAPATLQADAALLRQVLVNLLGNALRFAATTDAPRVVVGRATIDGGEAFYVEDNGPGFPPERAAELFRPFQRLHGGGLSHNGVGLSIVRRIVERHGGRVWAESPAGGGARFWFSLGTTPAA